MFSRYRIDWSRVPETLALVAVAAALAANIAGVV
jgi:hypothetical protein